MPTSDEVYEGYVVIRTALQHTGAVAIGQLIMHGRGHLDGIKAHGKGHLPDEKLGLRALLNCSHLLSTEVDIGLTAARTVIRGEVRTSPDGAITQVRAAVF